MGLYLGSSGKQKLRLNNLYYFLNLFSSTPIVDVVRLLSSDNYILKDSNGLYLVPKEGE